MLVETKSEAPPEQRPPRAAVRSRTISVKHMTKLELELGRRLFPEEDHHRPKTRAECAGVERPCPFVSCEHHLYLDVSRRTGSIKLNFPDIEVEDMVESCTLDLAERDGLTLEEVGVAMNVTRERVRQIEAKALRRVNAEPLREYVPEGAVQKRRLPVLAEDEDEPE